MSELRAIGPLSTLDIDSNLCLMLYNRMLLLTVGQPHASVYVNMQQTSQTYLSQAFSSSSTLSHHKSISIVSRTNNASLIRHQYISCNAIVAIVIFIKFFTVVGLNTSAMTKSLICYEHAVDMQLSCTRESGAVFWFIDQCSAVANDQVRILYDAESFHHRLSDEPESSFFRILQSSI